MAPRYRCAPPKPIAAREVGRAPGVRTGPLRRAALWALLGAGVLATGCARDPHRGEGGLQIAWRTDRTQEVGAPVRLEVQVSELDWTPRNGLEITVVPHQGADSLPAVEVRGRGAGLYTAEGFVFPRAGSWTLTAHATRPDGRWTERDLLVQVGSDRGTT